MTKELFNDLLSQSNLSKKEFSSIIGTSQGSVANWGTSGRDYPYWVESWLKLYIENKKYNHLKQAFKDTIIED